MKIFTLNHCMNSGGWFLDGREVRVSSDDGGLWELIEVGSIIRYVIDEPAGRRYRRVSEVRCRVREISFDNGYVNVTCRKMREKKKRK